MQILFSIRYSILFTFLYSLDYQESCLEFYRVKYFSYLFYLLKRLFLSIYLIIKNINATIFSNIYWLRVSRTFSKRIFCHHLLTYKLVLLTNFFEYWSKSKCRFPIDLLFWSVLKLNCTFEDIFPCFVTWYVLFLQILWIKIIAVYLQNNKQLTDFFETLFFRSQLQLRRPRLDHSQSQLIVWSFTTSKSSKSITMAEAQGTISGAPTTMAGKFQVRQ